MKLLVVATSYPSENEIYESAFLRPRVVAYHQAGCQVAVLNFKAVESYQLDGVEVLAPKDLDRVSWDWDLVISHAPNVRQHLLFLVKNWSRLPAVCLTFHGHEAMYLGVDYPKPYPWNRGLLYPLRSALQSLYDFVKISLLRLTIKLLSRRDKKLLLLFVSEDFRQTAIRNLSLDSSPCLRHSAVVWNPLAEEFLSMTHSCLEPLADFVTIRPLDGSKHCVDLVLECARQNPEHTFHVYGKGEFFKHNRAPQNLTHFPQFVHNADIPELLTRYRGALMPSRCDSHGVMMCEMAVTGIPVLASRIPVHLEALGDFPNVNFLDNECPEFSADDFLESCRLKEGDKIPDRFKIENTAGRELQLFRELLEE